MRIVDTSAQIIDFRYTIICMGETLNGKPVTDAQIDAWVAEAEAGYDVAELKKRGRGRPGRGAAPSEVIAVRLTADELAALDAAAKQSHTSRSETIRAALARHVA